jgi:hypothetical protein
MNHLVAFYLNKLYLSCSIIIYALGKRSIVGSEIISSFEKGNNKCHVKSGLESTSTSPSISLLNIG